MENEQLGKSENLLDIVTSVNQLDNINSNGTSLGVPTDGSDISETERWQKKLVKLTENSTPSLPPELLALFETKYNTDLSAIKIHLDDKQAEKMNAKAFTKGTHIYFAPNEYQPETKEGQDLIEHELRHVFQQNELASIEDKDTESLEGDADSKGARNVKPIKQERKNGNIQRKKKKEDDQEESSFTEEQYYRLTNEQQILIENFGTEAHSIIKEWEDLRKIHTSENNKMTYKEYHSRLVKMVRKLDGSYNKLRADFNKTTSYWTVAFKLHGGDLTNKGKINFDNHRLTYKEVKRQLDVGKFSHYIKEISLLHHRQKVSLDKYRDLLGITPKMLLHKYTLKTLIGTEARILQAKKAERRYRIEYSNELGMSWSKDITVDSFAAEAGAGVGGTPVGLNVESSFGSSEINAGEANTIKYYPPNYFNYKPVMGASGGADLAGAGSGKGILSIGEVAFNTSGKTLKLGTAAASVVSAGYQAEFGYAWKGGNLDHKKTLKKSEDIPNKEKEPMDRTMKHILKGTLYFNTEDMKLDEADNKVLDDMINSMMYHDDIYRGDIFLVDIEGLATERWRTPLESAKEKNMDTKGEKESIANSLNEKLAYERAMLTKQTFARKLEERRGMFDQKALKNSKFKVTSKVIPRNKEGNDNAAKDRRVSINIAYYLTPIGNTKYNKSMGK